VQFTVWALVAFVTLFFAVGFYAMVRAMLDARRLREGGTRPPSLAERVRAYIGPVSPDMARLSAPLRVFVEFSCALFGFPGLGWALSTRFVVGLTLMIGGPLVAWCLMPVILYQTGVLQTNIYSVVLYLPVWALVSSLSLAVVELRAARRRHVLGV
jgi:hypothetical protein